MCVCRRYRLISMYPPPYIHSRGFELSSQFKCKTWNPSLQRRAGNFPIKIHISRFFASFMRAKKNCFRSGSMNPFNVLFYLLQDKDDNLGCFFFVLEIIFLFYIFLRLLLLVFFLFLHFFIFF